VGALTVRGLVEPWVLDGPVNHEGFENYFANVLVPHLRPGDVVTMENFFSHKGDKVRAMIEAAGTTLRLLPPHSCDV